MVQNMINYINLFWAFRATPPPVTRKLLSPPDPISPTRERERESLDIAQDCYSTQYEQCTIQAPKENYIQGHSELIVNPTDLKF